MVKKNFITMFPEQGILICPFSITYISHISKSPGGISEKWLARLKIGLCGK
jgi:hypothetical protein